MKFGKFLRTTFLQNTLVAASVTKTDQKKQKYILRNDTLQIFLLKHNDAKKQSLMKVFYDYEILLF